METVLRLSPTKPFPGSSGVATSLAWFAPPRPTAPERAIVVDPQADRGRSVAAMLIEAKLRTDAVKPRSRRGMAECTAEADVQLIFVHRLVLEPQEGDFLSPC